MDVGRLLGLGRLGFVVGVLLVGGGFLLEVPVVAWVGVGLAGVGLSLSAVGKAAQYNSHSIPRTQRLRVVGAWLLLSATLVGLLVDYTYGRQNPGYEGFFWSFAVGAAGFSAVYWGLRTKYVTTRRAEGEAGRDEGSAEG